MRKLLKLIFVFLLILLFGCQNNNDINSKLEEIKNVGDNNPAEALAMLDSVASDVRKESEYVQMKYDLLNIRLHDKACDTPNSDITIKHLIEYFENNGSDLERQEVYYYAGSIYRDLKDTPRALEYFYKSSECAREMKQGCDSLLLRNTYSNICCIQLDIQDYNKSLKYAMLEYELSEQLKHNEINQIMHIGASHLYLHNNSEAKRWLDKAFRKASEIPSEYVETLYYLLYDYTYIGDKEMADKCCSLIKKEDSAKPNKYNNLNMGAYYAYVNNLDSAINCYENIINDGTDIFLIYDASKDLFEIYKKTGNETKALQYADLFIRTSDSIDLGKRQELMASVNNQFQYHLDKNAEVKMLEKSKRQHMVIIILSCMVVIIILTFAIIIIIRRSNHLKKVVELTGQLNSINEKKEQLQAEISKKSIELKKMQKERELMGKEINSRREELDTAQSELQKMKKEVAMHKQKLAENMERNNVFIRLIQQTEFEGKAHDVISIIRQSASGRNVMSAHEWRELYKAVDELYPDFKDNIIKELKGPSEQQLQVCYLIRIGLSKPEIQNLTGLSRVTIWRWTKKFSWVLEDI